MRIRSKDLYRESELNSSLHCLKYLELSPEIITHFQHSGSKSNGF